MPFPATHLYYASLIAQRLSITDLPGYYLGSVAPDSVIFREGWSSHDKFVSHLCAGNEAYEAITDTTAWLDSMLSLWAQWRDLPDPWFYAGWLSHAYLDMRHTQGYVLPCKKDHPPLMEDGSFRRDMATLDAVVYVDYARHLAFPALRRCTPEAYAWGCFSTDQLCAIHENLCHRQYQDLQEKPSAAYAYIDPQAYLAFLGKTALEAARILEMPFPH